MRFILYLLLAVTNGLSEWMDKEITENVWIKMFVSYPKDYDNAPMILFLNGGLGTPMASYVDQLKPYMKNYIFIAPEQRGVLSINGTEASCSLEEHIHDLGLVLDYAKSRFNRDKAIIWGISFGGTFAMLLSDERSESIESIIVTGPMIANIDKINKDKELIKRIEATGHETCEFALSNLPWYLSFLRLLGCPGPESNYWFSIFYFTQLFSKLGLMTKCEKKNIIGFCDPNYAPDIFSLIAAPYVGFFETARLGLSNVNYIMLQNIPVTDIYWKLKPIHNTLFVIGSRADRAISDYLLEDLYNDIEAPYKEIYWFQNAGHMMFLDSKEEHYRVFDKFVEKSKTFCTSETTHMLLKTGIPQSV
jgi:pimeloyl-ACP methyl ester carboxylesterase